MSELIQQKEIRENFEKRLKETEEKLAEMSELQSRQSYLEGENMFLKQVIVDSRSKQAVMQEKMERVLGLLYSAFVSSGGALGGAPRSGSGLLENGGSGQFLAIGDGTDSIMSDIFSEFTTDSGKQMDLSLSRLNSLRTDLGLPLLSSDTSGSSVNFTADIADASQSVQYLQNRNVAASSAAFQGKGLCRLHSFDDSHLSESLAESSRVETILDVESEMSAKRAKLNSDGEEVVVVGPQEQMELDLLRRNQEVTLERIDSLESTISNLLDFIDEFDTSLDDDPMGQNFAPLS
jgi:ferritin-like metal-binding protein YciE